MTSERVRALRARLFAALGLPGLTFAACKADRKPALAQATIVVLPADGGALETTGPPASADRAVARTCRVDEVLEYACGPTRSSDAARPASTCEPDATSLVRQVAVATLASNAWFWLRGPVAMLYTRDEALTERMRRRLASAPDGDAVCCYSQCAKANVLASARPFPQGTETELHCTPLFAAGTTFPAREVTLCAVAIAWPSTDHGAANFEARQGDTCCYRAAVPPASIILGRPLRERGTPIVAEARAHEDAWTGRPFLLPRHLGAARAWADAAMLEHASVAAFARVSLDLMALGAPPELVLGAHVAAGDEIRHARTSFAIAAALGEARAPGPMPIATTSLPAPTFLSVATEAFDDGCVGESVAAIALFEAARRCAFPEIAVAMKRMADEEASHAELAWRIVAWALREGGSEVTRHLRMRLREVRAETVAGRGELDAFGVLDHEAHARIAQLTMRDVILPCAERLFASATATCPSATMGR